jgi:hypothetical protein
LRFGFSATAVYDDAMAMHRAWAATPRLSPAGSRIARHALYLVAVNAVRRSAEWRTLYLCKKAQGKKAKQALIVVAVKLLHTVYAMLKTSSALQPLTPTRRCGDDWDLTSHGMSRWRRDGENLAERVV